MKIVLKNIAWLTLERGSQIVAAICIGALLARLLGVEGYGQFQYILAVVVIFSSLGLICGAEVLVPRLVDATSETTEKLIGDAFTLRLIGAVLAYVGITTYAFLAHGFGETTVLIAVLGLMVFFREPFGVVINLLQAKTNSKPAALIGTAAVAIKLLLILLLYSFHFQSILFISSIWLLETVLVAIGLAAIYQKRRRHRFFPLDLTGIKRLFMSGLTFWSALIAMYIFFRMDRILLREYRGLSELGLYSAAMQIAENMTLFAPIVASSAAPLLIYKESDPIVVRRNVLKLALGMFCLAVSGAIVGSLLAPWIIALLFGAAFADAAAILGVALFAVTLVFIDAALNTYLIKHQHGARVLTKWATATCVGFAVSFLAIPKLGAYGALLGISSGYLITIILGWYWIAANK